MNKFKDCVAVITGAGSGIGRELALQLGNAGAHLAISDINGETLETIEKKLSTTGVSVLPTVLDVADEDAFFAYAETVENHFNGVNLVINNAGVALASGPLLETTMADFKWLMDINFYGVVYGTKAFLPILHKANWGHIVNLSSLFGLVSAPEQAAYNASKFAVRGLTEALQQELKLNDCNVRCTSVHPGGIKTNIVRSARVSQSSQLTNETTRNAAIQEFDTIARTTAASAASQILWAAANNKKRLLIGSDARLIDKIQRLFPSNYDFFYAKIGGDIKPLAG